MQDTELFILEVLRLNTHGKIGSVNNSNNKKINNHSIKFP